MHCIFSHVEICVQGSNGLLIKVLVLPSRGTIARFSKISCIPELARLSNSLLFLADSRGFAFPSAKDVSSRSQTRHDRSLDSELDPEISIGWILFAAMSSENLVNMILVASVMSGRQISPRWRWIKTRETTHVSVCHTVLPHN